MILLPQIRKISSKCNKKPIFKKKTIPFILHFQFMDSNVINWNVEQVGNWLKQNELEHHVARFEKEGIDGSVLVDMDEFDFVILEIETCDQASIWELMEWAKERAKNVNIADLLDLNRHDLLHVLEVPMDQIESFEKAIAKLKKN